MYILIITLYREAMRQAQIKIIVSDASDPQSILVSLIHIHPNNHFLHYTYLLFFLLYV